MRTLLTSVLLGLALATSAWAGNLLQGVTLQAKTANATGTAISAKGFGLATFQVCCAPMVGTISFLASVDGTHFEALGCIPITSNFETAAPVTTATVTGIWRCDVRSITTAVRADLSGYGAGVVTVTVMLTER